ncbi:AMP-dependent synthetase and ligase OS=Tsukamurella paurometabola (strain ATCC 8368 / DSM /CCUG 35730 / CIP 100753 / JCM 10117 / KCTC 9821 / NBRC 16120/ NCIMB 702349 / NCTC 13040) OX=521096 GN=Tpau_2884 PE=3 SV=1 [Tsukamurella paurometabola]|uniref:AMP-dependent synthetase and ligase n=1 Tax=Tsukamurella paurometabola (strain ATCC 8368 / DSM 20162 / CCUG 35730 / CIP 100753 / JCM 10117 / KCTC 9821 / NBRC 16120 / NCIMB 702349 / NCTC 13040) TaxID=521096 RepID=D5UTJ7_TSUPD|nr:AMP-binding protein [Tsukamurella paurometabola]ADG79482.1 AMP-dependent synthetase and ligase [Tsukamurella paurometabola DSM 20162]SUP35928.1 Long-chain-fatty-acid--CoA ligase [Tsukamurella paurometabola]
MTIDTTPAVAADDIGATPRVRTITGLLADGAARTPDAELLRFGDESWTYRRFDEASSRLAHRLIETDGIAPGDRVAIMLPNIAGWPLTWLAALKAGAVAVPVNSAYRAADLQFVLTDSGARVIVTDGDHLPLVREVISGDPALAGVAVLDIAETADAAFPATAPEVSVGPETLANLQYTSGTTGFPKACMLTHDYWTRIGWVCAGSVGLGPDDVLLTAQPFSYMDPQWNTVLALTTGAPLVVLPRFSASGFMADVRSHGATFCYVLGSMPTLLFKQPPGPEDRDNRLRAVFCSAIPQALHADLEERWGAPWREVYGMTESGMDLYSPFHDVDAVGSGTLGHPVPTKQIRIVDADGTEVAAGTPGELTVSGAPMMLGYWNRPEATAETIRDGWLHTGDLAVVDEHGGIRLVGRLKDMVRRGGENVAAVEVEAALEHDDAVVASAVVAEPDPVLGEEVKAFVQLGPGIAAERATAAAIVARVAQRLAKFKVPRYIEFVTDFPRTPSQRVAKPTLKARAAEVPGTVFDLRASSSIPAPSNKENPVEHNNDPTEQVLVEMVREVAVITLRRPDKLNALTVGMRRRLAALIREYGTGELARGIVLTGTGRAFSAGEDLSAPPTDFDGMRDSFESFHDVTRAVIETRVPVIAAVNGIAVGGASEITLCCDARIGAHEARYYQPENSRGLTISNASSLLLTRIVRGHAMRMILGSEKIGAEEALRIGLLDEVVEQSALVDRAVETIHAWTPEGANTTALHLGLLRPTVDEIERAFAREDAAADEAWNSGALTAGVQSFWDARTTPATATTGGTR